MCLIFTLATYIKTNPLRKIKADVEKLFGRINNLGYQIQLTTKAKNYIADKGFDEKYGARPLNRAIQKYIEDPLAEEIIQKSIKEGDVIKLDYKTKEDEISVSVVSPKKKTKENKKEDN